MYAEDGFLAFVNRPPLLQLPQENFAQGRAVRLRER